MAVEIRGTATTGSGDYTSSGFYIPVPAGVQPGELLIAIVQLNGNAGNNPDSIGPVTSGAWTKIGNSNDVGAWVGNGVVFSRKAGQSEPSRWKFSGDYTSSPNAVMYAFKDGFRATRTWPATWSVSTDNFGSDFNSPLYQGFYSSGAGGNEYSKFGFDHTDIQNALSGATPVSIRLHLDNTHFYYFSGGRVMLGTHNEPQSNPLPNVGGWDRYADLNIHFDYDEFRFIDLPLDVAYEFKNDNTKGFTLGNPNFGTRSLYGYFIQAGVQGGPFLEITYDTSNAEDLIVHNTPTWSGSTSSTTNHPAPSITPTVNNSILLCAFMSQAGGSDQSYSAPDGMNEHSDMENPGQILTLSSASQSLNTSGSTGTKTASYSTSTGYLTMSMTVANSGSPVGTGTGTADIELGTSASLEGLVDLLGNFDFRSETDPWAPLDAATTLSQNTGLTTEPPGTNITTSMNITGDRGTVGASSDLYALLQDSEPFVSGQAWVRSAAGDFEPTIRLIGYDSGKSYIGEINETIPLGLANNSVRNPRFETDTTGWVNSGAPGDTLSQITGVSVTNSQTTTAARVSKDGSTGSNLSMRYSSMEPLPSELSPGDPFEATAYVRPNVSDGVNMFIDFFDSGGSLVGNPGEAPSVTPGADAWGKATVSSTVPANATQYEIFIGRPTTVSAGDTLDITDLRFEKTISDVNDWQLFSVAGQLPAGTLYTDMQIDSHLHDDTESFEVTDTHYFVPREVFDYTNVTENPTFDTDLTGWSPYDANTTLTWKSGLQTLDGNDSNTYAEADAEAATRVGASSNLTTLASDQDLTVYGTAEVRTSTSTPMDMYLLAYDSSLAYNGEVSTSMDLNLQAHGTNQIHNPDAATNLEGWKVFQNRSGVNISRSTSLTIPNTSTTTAIRIDNTNGSTSDARISSNGDSGGFRAPVTPGDPMDVIFRVRRNPDREVTHYIDWYLSSSGFVSSSGKSTTILDNTNTWQELSASYNVPNGVDEAVMVIGDANMSSGGWQEVTDVRFWVNTGDSSDAGVFREVRTAGLLPTGTKYVRMDVVTEAGSTDEVFDVRNAYFYVPSSNVILLSGTGTANIELGTIGTFAPEFTDSAATDIELGSDIEGNKASEGFIPPTLVLGTFAQGAQDPPQGYHRTRLGPPDPVPKNKFRYIVQAAVTGEILAWDLPILDDSVTVTLSGPASIEGHLEPELYWEITRGDDKILEPWGTIIHAEQNGTIFASCILQPEEYSQHEYGIAAEGFSGYADGTPYQREYSKIQVDPMDVVRELWDFVQSYPDSNLGIQVDDTTSPRRLGTPAIEDDPDTEADESREAEPYELAWWDLPDCGQEMNNLANSTPFEYREVTTWNEDKSGFNLRLALDYPRVGSYRTDLRFMEGENIIDKVSVGEPDDWYANVVVGTGAGEGREKIYTQAWRTIAQKKETNPRVPRLRRVSVYNNSRITKKDRLHDIVKNEVERRAVSNEISSIIIDAKHPNAPLGTFKVGDDILVQAYIPWVGMVRLKHRITEYSYDRNSEQAKLSLARSDTFRYGREDPGSAQ